MMGIKKIAANLSRMILSLDPLGDPCHSLLRLDSQLLLSEQYDLLDEMYSREYPIGKPHTNHFLNPVSSEHTYKGSIFSVHNLPGWSYSHAVCRYLKQGGIADTETQQLLASAMDQWPFVVESIAKHSELDKQSKWKNLLAHKFFQETRPHKGNVLLHISEIYAICSLELWKRPEIFNLLEKVVIVVLETTDVNSLIASRSVEFSNLSSSGSHLMKYASAKTEDFLAEFIRFPPDINPIDGQFLGD